MQYFSEAVLHCSWLNRLFPAGHHIDLTVILKPSEQRKQAIRDRNCSFRTFAFRLSDDELGLFGSCSALHTLNGLADGQNTFFKVNLFPLQSADLTDTQAHIHRDCNTHARNRRTLVQIFFKPELLFLVHNSNFRLILFGENDTVKYVTDSIFTACIAKNRLEQHDNIRQIPHRQALFYLAFDKSIYIFRFQQEALYLSKCRYKVLFGFHDVVGSR